MLKQKGGAQSIVLLPRHSHAATLCGSSDECDIVIKSPGLRPRHAVIEYNASTKSFWLRQLNSPRNEHKSQQQHQHMDRVPPPPPYPYEENTVLPQHLPDNIGRQHQQQVLRDGSIIELHSMDTLRFGKGAEAVEFIFKMPPVHQTTAAAPDNAAGSRQQSHFVTFGARPVLRKKCSLDREDISLPVVGSHIQPKAHADRFVRPKRQQSNQRLCQLRQQQNIIINCQQQQQQQHSASNGVAAPLRRSVSACRLIAVGADSPTKVAPSPRRADTPWTMGTNGTKSPNEYEQHSSAGSSVDSGEVARVAAGHNKEELLRRVQRLQAELSRRDAELAHLRQRLFRNGTTKDWQDESPSASSAPGTAKRVPPKRSTVTTVAAEVPSSAAQALLGMRATDIFFTVCAEELNILNTRLNQLPARDYSDIFNEINKLLHEPFSFRLMEINSKCAAVFESLQLLPVEKEHIYVQFDQFLKDKIYPISKAIDAFLGTLRECAQMARESARACAVFSQWSREFGDQLQLQPNWELMLYKVHDMQIRFRENGLTKHWLPPSLSPLLQVLIFELRNRMDEQKRQQKEAADMQAKTTQKIAELEKELENTLNGTKLDVHTTESQQHKAQVPRIELPAAINTLEEQLRSPLRSRCSSRHSSRVSARRRRRQLGTVITDDEDSQNSHEAHIDSPQTPPASAVSGVAQQRNIAMDRRSKCEQTDEESKEKPPWGDKAVAEETEDERDEKPPWGDKAAAEETEDERDEKPPWGDKAAAEETEDERDEEPPWGDKVEEIPKGKQEDDGEEKVRLALCHLDSVYSELDERRLRQKRQQLKAEEENAKNEMPQIEFAEELHKNGLETVRDTKKSNKIGEDNDDEEEEVKQFEWIERMIKADKGGISADQKGEKDEVQTHPDDGEVNGDGEEEAPHADGTVVKDEADEDEADQDEADQDEADQDEADQDEADQDEALVGMEEDEADQREEMKQEETDPDENMMKNEEEEKRVDEASTQSNEEANPDQAADQKINPDKIAIKDEEDNDEPDEAKVQDAAARVLQQQWRKRLDRSDGETVEAQVEDVQTAEDGSSVDQQQSHRDEEVTDENDGQVHPEEEDQSKVHPDEEDQDKQHPDEGDQKVQPDEEVQNQVYPDEEDQDKIHPKDGDKSKVYPDEEDQSKLYPDDEEAYPDKKMKQGKAKAHFDETMTKDETHQDEQGYHYQDEAADQLAHPDKASDGGIDQETDQDEAASDKTKKEDPDEALPEVNVNFREEIESQEIPAVVDDSHGQMEEDAAARVLQQQWRKRLGRSDGGGAVSAPTEDEPSADESGGPSAGHETLTTVNRSNQPNNNKPTIVEFWELVHNLADLLGIEVPPNRAHAMPQLESASDERQERQKAMDSILDRLKAMLDDLRQKNGHKTETDEKA